MRSTSGPPTRTAPGVRAVAGGALVTCALLGVLVAPGGAEETGAPFLVTDVELAPGQPVARAALSMHSMRLPAALARNAVHTVDADQPPVTRMAIPAGTILHKDHLRTGPGAEPTAPEVTMAVPTRRALGGAVSIGDVLDVIATYGSGTEGFSQVVATGVTVTAVSASEEGLGVEPTVTITVRLDTGTELLPVVHASHTDAVTLVADAGDRQADPETRFSPGAPDVEGPS